MAESIFVNLWPGWLAGAAISALVVSMLAARNRLLSVSFCYAFLVDRVTDRLDRLKPQPVHPEMPAIPGMSVTDAPVSNPNPSGDAGIALDTHWSTAFLLGILLGGLFSGVMFRWVGGSSLAFSMAYPGFDEIWKLSGAAKTALLFGGGILVGFGTRMSGGCTSGHAIVGFPAMQKASWIAMPTFFGVGIAVTFLVRYLLGV